VLKGIENIGQIPELRRRIFFTLFMLAVFRIGVQIPTPGIDIAALSAFFARAQGTLFGIFDMFSGGALEIFPFFPLV
jgi:preprotein translocase subunit SecY